MTAADRAELLDGMPLFASLPPEERRSLAGRMHSRHYRRGEAIIRFGDPGDSLCIVRSGVVKVTRPAETGEEAVVNIIGPGEFFGEMALLDGGPRSATVIALEPTEVLVLARSEFLQHLRAHPDAAFQVMTVLTQRIRRLTEQLEEVVFMELPQRLARTLLLLDRSRGAVGLTQGELAGMVGASRQRVNRLLAQWQDSGLIQLGRRGEVHLLQRQALAELSHR